VSLTSLHYTSKYL